MSFVAMLQLVFLTLISFNIEAKGHSSFNTMLKKELNLSKDQEERLEKIYSPDKSHMRTCYKEMEKASKTFEDVLHSANSTEEEIRSKFSELQKAQEEYAKARVDKVIAIRSILTPEQQEKFFSLLEKKKKRHKKH